MLLELFIRGITIGLVYALMGVGLALLNGVMRIINFAHGEFYMIGGYMAYYSSTMLGFPFYFSVPTAMIVTFLLGAVVEKLLLSPIHTQEMEKPMDYALIMTFGLLLFFRQLAIKIFGPFRHKPADYITSDVYILGVKISGNEVLAGVVSAILVIGLALFIKKTWRGRGWRATTQSRNGAKINGVDIGKESWIACGVACALAGAAGALVAPIFTLSPTIGGSPLVKSYEVMAIGGLGSIAGSLVAGLMLGITETLGAFYISSAYK
ncbi:MAG: branched-chain amino acid ABC transporter permease, partial [Desulfobacula sp.]|nr:branched-chain amino acid ABC transporter permease [Desulfobacula sp.]